MARLGWKTLKNALFGGKGSSSRLPGGRQGTEEATRPDPAGTPEPVLRQDPVPATNPPGSSGPGGGASKPASIREELGSAQAAPVRPTSSSESTQVSLDRSLKWRSQVLLNTPGIEDPKGDGRRLVDELLGGADAVVRRLPQAAQKALSISRDPNSGTRDLVLLFERDPTLTQSLLQRANSPWYRRGPDSIESIIAAVQRIGAKGVENLFLESVVKGLLCRPGGVYNRMVSTEWSTMLNSSAQARRLAPAFGLDADPAHSLGLLHDVGKLVIFDRISVMRGELRRDVEIPDGYLYRLLDRLHEPLGAQAVLHWGMGGQAAYAVAHHHRQPVPEGHEPMTELLYVADALDLATARLEDWDEVWKAGAITADLESVQEICRRAA